MNDVLKGLLFGAVLKVLLCGVMIGQFPIKLPSIPKSSKPKPAESAQPTEQTSGPTPLRQPSSPASTAGGRIYGYMKPSSTPMILKPKVFIQAVHNQDYWKMKTVRDATSWLPQIQMQIYWNQDRRMDMVAEWYNPDGSLWFTENLDTGTFFKSGDTWSLMDTKSTNATGVFSVKVKNKATGELFYEGKFRVYKFPISDPPTKNNLGFSVDHDSLLPLGMVGFSLDGDITKATSRVLFSTWLKGRVRSDELEAQLFYEGKMIARATPSDGMATDERASKYTPAFDAEGMVKRWEIFFGNVLLANGNDNPRNEYWASTHWIDKNPGNYVYKLFRNGTQIREFSFEVGADGRFVRPAYSDSFFFPQYSILFPAKVMGTTEKWNTTTWKTDMFYGNPISGYTP